MPAPRIDSYGVTALDGLTEANQDRPFADLVTPLVPAAQRLAFGMLQNAHDSEDAVQEATFKAWRAFPRLREQSNIRAWFLTIVANECRQRRRNRWWSILKLGATVVEEPTPSGSDEAAMDLRRAGAVGLYGQQCFIRPSRRMCAGHVHRCSRNWIAPSHESDAVALTATGRLVGANRKAGGPPAAGVRGAVPGFAEGRPRGQGAIRQMAELWVRPRARLCERPVHVVLRRPAGHPHPCRSQVHRSGVGAKPPARWHRLAGLQRSRLDKPA